MHDIFDYDEEYFLGNLFIPEEDEEVACKECNGEGKYLLFHQYHTCKVCNGKKIIAKSKKDKI